MNVARVTLRPGLLVAALVLGAGCDQHPLSHPCIDIGCSDQVRVQVVQASGQPVSDFAGSVTIDGKQFDVACSNPKDGSPSAPGVTCDGDSVILVANPQAPTATVALTANGGSLAFNGTAAVGDKSTLRPAGDDCPPTCTVAKATVLVSPTP